MIKAGANLVKERDWFYVGEAVRQSVLFSQLEVSNPSLNVDTPGHILESGSEVKAVEEKQADEDTEKRYTPPGGAPLGSKRERAQ